MDENTYVPQMTLLCPYSTKQEVLKRINNLCEDLQHETDEESFSDGKEEVLELLDLLIHTYKTTEHHYNPLVKSIVGKQSRIDIELEERILKGVFYVSEMAIERNVTNVLKGLKLLVELRDKQQNRKWGIKGIFYTETREPSIE